MNFHFPIDPRKKYLVIGSFLIVILVFLVVLRSILSLPQQEKSVTSKYTYSVTEKPKRPTLAPTSPAATTIPQPQMSVWNTASNADYGLTFRYPANWKVTAGTDNEKDPKIVIRSAGAKNAPFSARLLPEITIGVRSPYSTSGALCANQLCEDFQKVQIVFNQTEIPTQLIKASVVQNGSPQFDFYAFNIDTGIKVKVPSLSSETTLQIYVSFGHFDDLKPIRDIISSIIYDPDMIKVKPKIVEEFLCGDYCPGSAEQYMKHVYEGVTDENECRELGGTPYTYIGLIEKTVCLAPETGGSAQQNISTIRSALELYRMDNTAYPENVQQLVPTYLVALPDDFSYSYTVSPGKQDYTLSVTLKDGSIYEEHAP